MADGIGQRLEALMQEVLARRHNELAMHLLLLRHRLATIDVPASAGIDQIVVQIEVALLDARSEVTEVVYQVRTWESAHE